VVVIALQVAAVRLINDWTDESPVMMGKVANFVGCEKPLQRWEMTRYWVVTSYISEPLPESAVRGVWCQPWTSPESVRFYLEEGSSEESLWVPAVW